MASPWCLPAPDISDTRQSRTRRLVILASRSPSSGRHDGEAVTGNDSDGRHPYDGTHEAESQNIKDPMTDGALPGVIFTQHHVRRWPRFIVLSGILIGSLDRGIYFQSIECMVEDDVDIDALRGRVTHDEPHFIARLRF